MSRSDTTNELSDMARRKLSNLTPYWASEVRVDGDSARRARRWTSSSTASGVTAMTDAERHGDEPLSKEDARACSLMFRLSCEFREAVH